MYKYLLLIIVSIFMVNNIVLSCESHMNPNYSVPKQIPVPLTVVSGEELATHEARMQEIIDYAIQTKQLFVASIYHNNGTRIAMEMNLGKNKSDSTLHAEIAVIQKANDLYKINNFADYILYTTGESCPMCMAAIMWSSFSTIVYGSSIKDLYCNNCMGQIPIDSTFIAAYGYGLKDNWVPPTIIGGVSSDQTDTKVFKNYCNATSIFRVDPLCKDPNSSSSTTNIGLLFTIFVALISYLLI